MVRLGSIHGTAGLYQIPGDSGKFLFTSRRVLLALKAWFQAASPHCLQESPPNMSGQHSLFRGWCILVWLVLPAFLHGCAASSPADPKLLQISVTLPSAQTGAVYTALIAVTGGTAPYSWSITAGSLPAGLTLNTSNGVISG